MLPENAYAPTVRVVDDDEAIRTSLTLLLRTVELSVQTYLSARDFLAQDDSSIPGCVVLDVRMPGLGGLALQERLCTQEISLPVIMITGFADVPMAAKALRAGAVDFIQKPFNDQFLLDRIGEAIDLDARRRRQQRETTRAQRRLADLNGPERRVLDLVVAGRLNKQIARKLQCSEKTVEKYRSTVMKKLAVESLPQLIRLVLKGEGLAGKPALCVG